MVFFPGPIVDIENYKTIGEHQGVHLWTLGQGTKVHSQKSSTYVCDKDKTTNTLYVCKGSNHPALYCENFHTEEPYWIDHAPEELSNRSQDQVKSNMLYKSGLLLEGGPGGPWPTRFFGVLQVKVVKCFLRGTFFAAWPTQFRNAIYSSVSVFLKEFTN